MSRINLQRDELARLEGRIQSGAIEMVEAFREIHRKRLYLLDYKSFQEYAKMRWGISRAHAHRLLSHGQVLGNLGLIGESTSEQIVYKMSPTGDKNTPSSTDVRPSSPSSRTTPVPGERQSRELAKAPADKQQEIWREANRRSAGKPTAADVARTRDSILGVHGDGEADLSSPSPDFYHQMSVADLNIGKAIRAIDRAKDAYPAWEGYEEIEKLAGMLSAEIRRFVRG